ncbi:hypothetical protein E4T52_02819 [Aureobasidium sp. EXF-3400]|nr:hypothetical protein E4T52_02819 [Aureobasidium sp. EXF-3400]
MPKSNVSDDEPDVKPARLHVDLFDNKALSDVRIKLRDGESIHGDKQILAQKSEWFFRAFNGNFPFEHQVASSNEICLDDTDEDPEAIRTMIRHIYDPNQHVYLALTIKAFMFHVNVFAAADKYNVPSLRVLVIPRFTQLMMQRWSTNQQEFCRLIRYLCGPTAPNFADTSLQRSAAAFCSENITDLIKLDAFVSTLEECGPLAASLSLPP